MITVTKSDLLGPQERRMSLSVGIDEQIRQIASQMNNAYSIYLKGLAQ